MIVCLKPVTGLPLLKSKVSNKQDCKIPHEQKSPVLGAEFFFFFVLQSQQIWCRNNDESHRSSAKEKRIVKASLAQQLRLKNL